MALRGTFDSEFGRRRFLTRALGSGLVLAQASRIFAAADFWNTKDPSTWTEEEINLITSKSPWARQAVPNLKNTDDPTGASGGGRGGEGLRNRPQPIYVRWESAQPILDALRAPRVAEFEGHYIVSVTNLPIAPARRPGRGAEPAAGDSPDEVLERLQNGATLQVKGKDTGEAGIARRTRIGSILFGFSKDYLHLAPTDREIVFALETRELSLKTKFDGKDMMYRGMMAV